MRRKNALGAVLAWRITTMWFGLAIVFRESGLKNQVTRLLLDLVGETLKCLSILHWCENMSWMSGMRMSPLTGLTTKDGAFLGGSPLRLECYRCGGCRSLRNSRSSMVNAHKIVDDGMRMAFCQSNIRVLLLSRTSGGQGEVQQMRSLGKGATRQ